jgi:hypothetical protein
MPQDMTRRISLARIDDIGRRSKVSTARKLIYEKDYAVDSAAVERLLKPQSLVPTSVSIRSCHYDLSVRQSAVECLLRQAVSLRLQLIPNVCC